MNSSSKINTEELYNLLLARAYQHELFSDLGQHKNEGKDVRTQCPYCQGNDFTFSKEKPTFHCWNCDKGGDWITYLQEIKGYSFIEAAQYLADAAGVALEGLDEKQWQAKQKKAQLLEVAQEFLQASLKEETPVHKYLSERGYSQAEIELMELGALNDANEFKQHLLAAGFNNEEVESAGLFKKNSQGKYYCHFRQHPLITLWKDAAGRAIGMVGRVIKDGVEPKYLYTPSMRRDVGLLGLAKARGKRQIMLVEGVMDVKLLQAKGINNVVATGGTSLSKEQLRSLELAGCEVLYLAFDNDKAGQKATHKLIKDIRADSFIRPYVLQFANYKDLDELVRAEGVETLKNQATRLAWHKWETHFLLSQHDTVTDEGLDEALETTLTLYYHLADRIQRRQVLELLQANTKLTEEELLSRAEAVKEKQEKKRLEQRLKSLSKTLQIQAETGDIWKARQLLQDELEHLSTEQSFEPPEPYTTDRFLTDILNVQEGLKTGWSHLDEVISIPIGAITLVAGRPSHGKTTTLLNMYWNMLELYPEKTFYFFSYEEAAKNLSLKLLLLSSGVILNKQTNQGAFVNYLKNRDIPMTEGGGLSREEQRIEYAIGHMKQLTDARKLYLVDERLTAEALVSTVTQLSTEADTGAVFIDYIQKVPLAKPSNQRYVDVKLASELILEAAVHLDIPIIMGAQLGRGDNRSGDKRKIRLDNLRESGDLEQDANLVLGVYHPAMEQAELESQEENQQDTTLQIIPLKNRGGGAVQRNFFFNFHKPTLRLEPQQNAGTY